MFDPTAPIGVFDSGLGGLTVASAIAQRLPHEGMIYLGDTARVPYGTRSPATVVRYARNNAAFLADAGIKLLVVACNTVSAQGLGGLADGSGIPVVGVIRPGARAALDASAGGPIAVLGTQVTVRSLAYEHAIHELDPGRPVHALACPLFVPLVEEGWNNHTVTRMVAREYLAGLAGTEVDTIILGCTHYPIIRGVIAEAAAEVLGREVTIVDSATAVADQVATLLGEWGRGAPVTAEGRRRFVVTDAPDRIGAAAAQFWGGGDAPTFEHVDVTDRGVGATGTG
ncbi:MAG: glutamate racemase [Myxococcales bacterium]|nr:glutamate racemase [Myxococcales bacterium]MCB9545989.1 glutamate racemase [Myxococcales bacterium]